MFKNRYHICSLFGIPVYLDASLLFLALWFMFGVEPFFGLSCAALLMVSITLHELGHALTARAFGFPTRDITLSVMGGCASLLAIPRKAWQEFLVAAAGPAVSFILASIGYVLCVLFSHTFLYSYALYFTYMNFVLGCFNLLPGFPMDGGRILRSILQQFFMPRLRATWWAARVGRVFAVLLGFWGVYKILTIGLFASWGLVTLYIAYTLYKVAGQEYLMVLAEESGHKQARNPFEAFTSMFHGARQEPSPFDTPPDDGQAIVSPPPYARGSTRVDVREE